MILPKESEEQIALHQWCIAKRLTSFAVPNGGTRNKLEAISLKKQGVIAGVSDYCVVLKNKVLFIELKRRKKKLKSGKLSTSGTKVSDEQTKFIDEVNKSDVCVGVVAYGAREAIKFIEEHSNEKN